MLSPAAIQFGPLFGCEGEFLVALRIREALPESDREFGTFTGRQLEKLRKRAGLHVLILSREALPGNLSSRIGAFVRVIRGSAFVHPAAADHGALDGDGDERGRIFLERIAAQHHQVG